MFYRPPARPLGADPKLQYLRANAGLRLLRQLKQDRQLRAVVEGVGDDLDRVAVERRAELLVAHQQGSSAQAGIALQLIGGRVMEGGPVDRPSFDLVAAIPAGGNAGGGAVADIERAFLLGAFDYIRKPFNPRRPTALPCRCSRPVWCTRRPTPRCMPLAILT